MPNNSLLQAKQLRWNYWVFFLLFSCIFLAFSNTWFAAWHLDDFPNIINNTALHLQNLSPSTLYQTFFANPVSPHTLYRPIACISFALNWLSGQNNVFGYHIFNITLHFLTASLLYLTILLIFKTPNLKGRWTTDKAQLIALLSALLWALNPIQTQAVTYIVQRMALLAGFFYLGALFFYLKGRLLYHRNNFRRILYFILSLCCFILALGSKENAVTLPIALVLIEVIFLNGLQQLKWKYFFYFLLPFFCLTIIGVFILTDGHLNAVLAGYEHRNFTLNQRLLTEPRIILFYLSQIFYPIASRFSLDHDIVISTSLITPLATIFSLGGLLILTIWPLLFYKKYPLAAFALLFFLLNHTIESSIIPLELIFEHRNYLPSMFLFLPLSNAGVCLLDRYGTQSSWIRIAFYCFFLLLTLEFGLSTFQRNNVWTTEQSLWEDGLKKAPGSSRPYINLAFIYRQKGFDQKAFNLCRQSLGKHSPAPEKDRMRAYNNMGLIMMDYNKFPLAAKYFLKAMANKSNIHSQYYLHQAYLAKGDIQKAKKILEKILIEFSSDSHLLTSMGILLTTEKNYNEAESFFHQALENSKHDFKEQVQATICLGSLYSREGLYAKAKENFILAQSLIPTAAPTLCLLGNELRQKNFHQASIIRQQLIKIMPLQQILKTIKTSYLKNLIFPLDAKSVSTFVTEGIDTAASQ